jgi:cation transport regulator ChaC
MTRQYVFGYGSLLRAGEDGSQPDGTRPCHLRGYRRAWNVAMDNSLSVPGYKYYRDARDGSRPQVFVAFLNLVPAPGASVNGVLFPVDSARLAELDRRERNYERCDVSESLSEPFDGRVWTYIGSQAAEQRFRDGFECGCAVIDKRYLDSVREGFKLLTDGSLEEFEASTDPHGCAVLELARIDLD